MENMKNLNVDDVKDKIKESLHVTIVDGNMYVTKTFFSTMNPRKNDILTISRKENGKFIITRLYGGKQFDGINNANIFLKNLNISPVDLTKKPNERYENVDIVNLDGKLVVVKITVVILKRELDGKIMLEEIGNKFRINKLYYEEFSSLEEAKKWIDEQQ